MELYSRKKLSKFYNEVSDALDVASGKKATFNKASFDKAFWKIVNELESFPHDSTNQGFKAVKMTENMQNKGLWGGIEYGDNGEYPTHRISFCATDYCLGTKVKTHTIGGAYNQNDKEITDLSDVTKVIARWAVDIAPNCLTDSLNEFEQRTVSPQKTKNLAV